MFEKKSSSREGLKQYFTNTPLYFPLQEAKALLASKKYATILRKLPLLANAPKPHYEALYRKTIDDYAEFVQGLPAIKAIAFNQHGGLLSLGLERASRVLTLYREKFPTKGIAPENMSPQLALQTYALFTAALFYDIGYVATSYWISVCNAQGNDPVRWNPYQGNMLNLGQTHYSYCFEETINRDALVSQVTNLIVRQLLPAEGFEWIASDKELFGYWLSVLQKEDTAGGFLSELVLPMNWELVNQEVTPDVLAKIAKIGFSDIEADEVQKHLAEYPFKEEGQVASTHREGKTTSASQSNDIGHAFTNWVRNNIKTLAKTASLGISADGIMQIDSEIFQSFVKDNPHFKNRTWQNLTRSLEAKTHHMPGAKKGQSYMKGKTSLAHHMHIPAAKTGKQQTLAAIRLPAEVVLHALTSPITHGMTLISTVRAYPPLPQASATNTITPSKGK